MNKKLIRLTESDLHKIVKESVNKIINEIGDTEKGQDALGQVRGRADKRSQLLGGAMGNKYRKISHDAQEKAYSQGEKHGFDIYDPNGAYDKGISKGYEKARTNGTRTHRVVKESVNRILKEDDYMDVKYNDTVSKLRQYLSQISKLITEYENEFGQDAINFDEFLSTVQSFIKQLNTEQL